MHTQRLGAAVLTALLLAWPLTGAAAQEVCDFDATAEAGARWQVLAGDSLVSEHTQLYQALERAVRVEAARPGDSTWVEHAFRLRVECPVVEELPDDTSTADPAPAPAPAPQPGAVAPVVTFDPDDFASTAELSSGGAYGQRQLIHLDAGVPHPGGTSSMRFDYPSQGAGNALVVGRRVPLPSPVKELWVEAQVRWSSNYMCCLQLDRTDQDPSTDITSHKLLFGQANATATAPNWETSDGRDVYRWGFLLPGPTGTPPTGPFELETPQVADPATTNPSGGRLQSSGQVIQNIRWPIERLFDGQWHTLRLHWRHAPGRYQVWIDGQQVADLTGFDVHPEAEITALLLGRNKDDGNPTGTESVWWGAVSAWTQDPGW